MRIILKLQNYANNRHDFGLVEFLEEKLILLKCRGIFLSALLFTRNLNCMGVQLPCASTAGIAAQEHGTKFRGPPTWVGKLYYGL
jgi:hypothetical protein